MPVITIETVIHAPPEICFDLALDVDAHAASTPGTDERAVAGMMTGQLGMGDWVTFEATHFGVRQQLTAQITFYDRPRRFVDEMVQGIFAGFHHEHRFEPISEGTLMIDVFAYTSPLGVLGLVADVLFLESYMSDVLLQRCRHLKVMAERQLAALEEVLDFPETSL